MLETVGNNIERLDYKMERLTKSVAHQQNASPVARASPFKIDNPKFDNPKTNMLEKTLSNSFGSINTDRINPGLQMINLMGGHKTRQDANNFLTSPLPSKKVLPPILRESQMSNIHSSIDASIENQSQVGAAPSGQEISPDGIGAVEYYERREHTKLHEKLDFIVD